MKKNQIIILIAICTTVILLFILSNKIYKNLKKNVIPNNQNVEENEKYELEEWEIDFLIQKTSINDYDLTREELKKGKLNGSQKLDLEEARKFIAYLKQKYPSYKFKVINYGHPEFGVYLKYDFMEEKSSKIYSGIKNKDGEYSDSFFSDIFSDEYSKDLKNKIEENDVNIVAIGTEFTNCENSRVREGMKISEIQNLKLNNNVTIYLNSNSNCTINQLKSIIEKINLIGKYNIYKSDLFKDNMTVDECYNIFELENRKRSSNEIEKHYFSVQN